MTHVEPIETVTTEHGTVKKVPYVGDSPIVVATCKHGDFENIYKGAPMSRGEKGLAEHYAAKHGD